MFVDAKTGAGPYVKADSARNAIILKGTAEQVADAKAALKAIGEDAETGGGNMRIISLDRGSAASIAAELERMLKEMRKNPVKLVVPGQGPAVTPPASTQPTGNPNPPPVNRPMPNNGGGQGNQQLSDPQAGRTPPAAGSDKPVTITAVGNKLIINSEDPAALALTQELVRLLTSTSATGDFEVIRLKNADATSAAKVLDEVFNGKQQGQQPQFGGFGGR